MNLLTHNNRFLTITILCSVLLHLVGLWFLGSLEQKIRIEIAGQRHINVSLADASARPQASPENTKPTTPPKARQEKELKKEPSKEKPAKPLKHADEMAQAQKQQAIDAKALEPVKEISKTARDKVVTSRSLGPAIEAAKTQPVPALENTIKPEPVKQAQAENRTDVQETASVAQASEMPREMPQNAEPAESEAVSPPVPAIPRYQLGSTANPEPDYPMLARKKGWQGDVILGVHLEADGSIKHLTFVKSTDYGILNHAAYETVRTQWRFDPIEGDSTLENSYIEVPISFRFE